MGQFPYSEPDNLFLPPNTRVLSSEERERSHSLVYLVRQFRIKFSPFLSGLIGVKRTYHILKCHCTNSCRIRTLHHLNIFKARLRIAGDINGNDCWRVPFYNSIGTGSSPSEKLSWGLISLRMDYLTVSEFFDRFITFREESLHIFISNFRGQSEFIFLEIPNSSKVFTGWRKLTFLL